jgi:hypothetical protein
LPCWYFPTDRNRRPVRGTSEATAHAAMCSILPMSERAASATPRRCGNRLADAEGLEPPRSPEGERGPDRLEPRPVLGGPPFLGTAVDDLQSPAQQVHRGREVPGRPRRRPGRPLGERTRQARVGGLACRHTSRANRRRPLDLHLVSEGRATSSAMSETQRPTLCL